MEAMHFSVASKLDFLMQLTKIPIVEIDIEGNEYVTGYTSLITDEQVKDLLDLIFSKTE